MRQRKFFSAARYRKRFLVANNEQNGGDMVPLFWNGEIKEGFASWTRDFEFARVIFKKDARPGGDWRNIRGGP